MISFELTSRVNIANFLDEEISKFRYFSAGQPPYMMLNLSDPEDFTPSHDASVLQRLIQLALSACYLSGRYDYPVLISSNNDADSLQITFQTPWDGTGLTAPADSAITPDLRWVFLQPKRDVQRDLSVMLLKKFAMTYGIGVSVRRSSETGFTITCTLPWNTPHRRGERAKPLLLVVEDIKPIYMLMNVYLQGAGFDTVWAQRGDTGYQMAQELMPDMIILNICMPVMDGYQCLKQLKGDERTRMIPVVMCSVLRDVELSLELGAVDHIVKPIIRDDFLGRVRRFLLPRRSLVRRPVSVLDNVCLLSASDAWNARMKSVFDVDRKTAINTSGDFALDHVLHLQVRPDAFILDMEQDWNHLQSMVMTIRLTPHFEDVPIIAVTSHATDAAARYWYDGLVDKYVSEDILLRETTNELQFEAELAE